MKAKRPFVPPERRETVRHRLVDLLSDGSADARELSAAAGIPEREVYDHLEQIRHNRHEYTLVVTPAACRGCGFVFGKRERVTKPGKCPVCRGEHIIPPKFAIEPTPHHRPRKDHHEG
ncbi:transcriptional regulator [Geobacter sp. DSM 9736]|uniref:transcriptional regulator n=1 Tax=Geobacter sp. DSM 9736 TaxID=1277350 RepID=UPI000B5104AB|nr:transcriptional regulator [Geobacter sp. DSM 9736]